MDLIENKIVEGNQRCLVAILSICSSLAEAENCRNSYRFGNWCSERVNNNDNSGNDNGIYDCFSHSKVAYLQ